MLPLSGTNPQILQEPVFLHLVENVELDMEQNQIRQKAPLINHWMEIVKIVSSDILLVEVKEILFVPKMLPQSSP